MELLLSGVECFEKEIGVVFLEELRNVLLNSFKINEGIF